MLNTSARIRGDGVAARCCAHLLAQAGYHVAFEPSGRARVPLLMLSEAAQRLIRDIFQRDELFRDLPVIRKRVVAWGTADAVELEHSAVVISEEDLLERLGVVSGEAEEGWTICAAPPLPGATVEHRFGSRMAWPVRVEMAPADKCWIESLEDGWLFLNSGWLIAVGSRPEDLLEKSRLIKTQIAGHEAATVQFPASPRMVTPLGGEGWISCGTAAMSFDPLCGDGTAHAVREAILASAVVRAAGEDAGMLLAHYEARLTAGFQRHLSETYKFYASGGIGPWWWAQAESAGEGISWCGERMSEFGGFQYRLEGLELKRVTVPEGRGSKSD